MEFYGGIRASTDLLRFSHSHGHEIYSREEERKAEEAHLRGEPSHEEIDSPLVNMMEYHESHHHHHQQAATYVGSSTNYRPISRASPNSVQNHHMSLESQCSQHPWGRSQSVSSLSNSSCGSDSDTGGAAMIMSKSSAKSSPMGSSHRSMNNYDFSQTDSGASSARTMDSSDDQMQELSYSSKCPSDEELSEVFSWVDENNDGLICGSDLRGFMSRVLAFEISENEAENLLLLYGNGRTLGPDHHHASPGGRQRNGGGGAVVDVEGFLSLYQCLCGEPASPEEQSMMAHASLVFDKTQLQPGRWV
ncbi:unnamed protein product [Calypogeia fissa]